MLNVGPCSERCQNGEKQAGVTSVQDPGLGGRASVECRLTKALRNNDCDIEGTQITKFHTSERSTSIAKPPLCRSRRLPGTLLQQANFPPWQSPPLVCGSLSCSLLSSCQQGQGRTVDEAAPLSSKNKNGRPRECRLEVAESDKKYIKALGPVQMPAGKNSLALQGEKACRANTRPPNLPLLLRSENQAGLRYPRSASALALGIAAIR